MSTVKIKWRTRNSISGTALSQYLSVELLFSWTLQTKDGYIIEVTLKMKMIPYIVAKMDKKWVVIVDI